MSFESSRKLCPGMEQVEAAVKAEHPEVRRGKDRLVLEALKQRGQRGASSNFSNSSATAHGSADVHLVAVAFGAAVETAPRDDMHRMGELRQHEIFFLPLLPHCTEAWILS